MAESYADVLLGTGPDEEMQDISERAAPVPG